MDYSNRLNISYYKTIAVINETHKVFLVQHQTTNKIYVKKVLDVYNSQIYAYLQQNKIIGIPQIIDAYEENNQLTIIEQFISGSSLQDMIISNDLSITSMIHYICELCDILEKLHSLNPPIIHRDIKPSNIMITTYNHAMLIDFNAAKYLTDENATDTILLGTKGYAAPEQYGFGSSTPQTDIYALGILLKEFVSTLSAPTDQFHNIINKCTQINPSDRFESVTALKQELKKIIEKPSPKTSNLFTWQALIPPGYRSLTPWKMLVATMSYLFILWCCSDLTVENTFGAAIWISRFICLCIMLSIVFVPFNYCNIQRLLPLCKSKNKFVHYIGILLLTVIIIFLLIIVWGLFLSIMSQ